MSNTRYKSKYFDFPLYVGTKTQMENFMNGRSKRFRETHKIKKLPFIKGGKNKFGIFRK